ncbi:HEAT repeat domain-containing protein [bacterium]|nr:HEAT repeat domain-containing protein [bacterium]
MKKLVDSCIDRLSHSDNRKKQKARVDIQNRYSKEPETLFSYLSHPDWKVRYEIFKVLLGFGKKLTPVLINNLRSNNEDIFYWTCRLISHYKSTKISKELIILVEDENTSLGRKKLLVEALSHMRDDKSLGVLVGLFDSEYWVLRRQASDGLIRRIGKKSLDVLLSVKKPSEHVEYWLARTLMNFEKYHKNTEDFFVECLKSKNEEVIKLSLSYFEEYKCKGVMKNLLSLLNHELWSIKRMTAEILCEYGKSVIPDLEELIRTSTSNDEKYWVSRILGEIPISNHKLGEIMSLLVTDSSPYIRSSAILNIGKCGIKTEIYKIIQYVDDPNVEVRKNLAIALGENLFDKKIKDALMNLMDDPDEWVRHYARLSYERLKNQ